MTTRLTHWLSALALVILVASGLQIFNAAPYLDASDKTDPARRVPPARYPSFEAWSEASQLYQANLVRSQVEALRRLRGRPTGGFAVHFLNDAQPAVSCSLLDFERRPKAAFEALQAACAPVLVTADWPAPSYRPGGSASFAIHVVNDGPQPLAEAVFDAHLTWPGGGRHWRLAGDVAAASATFVGRLTAVLPDLATLRANGGASGGAMTAWPLRLDLHLRWGSPAQSAVSSYRARLTTA